MLISEMVETNQNINYGPLSSPIITNGLVKVEKKHKNGQYEVMYIRDGIVQRGLTSHDILMIESELGDAKSIMSLSFDAAKIMCRLEDDGDTVKLFYPRDDGVILETYYDGGFSDELHMSATAELKNSYEEWVETRNGH